MVALDNMIRQLELDLGQAQSKTPFDLLRQKYGSGAKPSAPKKEEPKKAAEAPKKEEQKQEKKPKAAKPNKGGPAPKVDLNDELAIFNSCDLRVGKIVECEIRPDSEKLYFEKIDLGEGQLREIGSGL